MSRLAREWKTIRGWDNKYEISNYGELRNKQTLQLYKPNSASGYETICLLNNGKRKWYAMHRLVLEHFVGKPKHKQECNHRDGNKFNNKASNLEWVTHQENMSHINVNRSPAGKNKIPPEQQDLIKQLYNNVTAKKIAEMFEVSIHYVHTVAKRS